METYNKSDELTHHGVKGQKWGVRRTEAQLARARGKVKKLTEKLEKQGGTSKGSSSSNSSPGKKTVKDLSDSELNTLVKRLELEKRYSDLMPKTVSFGKKLVDEMLIPAMIEGGKNVIRDTVTNTGKNLITKALSDNGGKKK